MENNPENQKKGGESLPISYRIMRQLADSANKLHDYTLFNARIWSLLLVATVVVSILAWYADFTVLCGVWFIATANLTTSYILAAPTALLITILILGCGGKWVTISINGMAGKRGSRTQLQEEFAVQWRIYFCLFWIGFLSTIVLSYNTDSSARANAKYNEANLEALRDTTLSKTKTEYLVELAKLDTQFAAKTQLVTSKYQSESKAKIAEQLAKIAEKVGKLEKKAITEYSMKSDTSRYRARITAFSTSASTQVTNAELALKNEKESLAKQLLSDYQLTTKELKDKYQTKITEIKNEVAFSATFYQWLNIGLNLLGFVLMLGMCYFNRGANRGKKSKYVIPTDPTPTNNDNGTKTTIHTTPNTTSTTTNTTSANSTNPHSPASNTIAELDARIKTAIYAGNTLLASDLNVQRTRLQTQLENELEANRVLHSNTSENTTSSTSPTTHKVVVVNATKNTSAENAEQLMDSGFEHKKHIVHTTSSTSINEGVQEVGEGSVEIELDITPNTTQNTTPQVVGTTQMQLPENLEQVCDGVVFDTTTQELKVIHILERGQGLKKKGDTSFYAPVYVRARLGDAKDKKNNSEVGSRTRQLALEKELYWGKQLERLVEAAEILEKKKLFKTTLKLA